MSTSGRGHSGDDEQAGGARAPSFIYDEVAYPSTIIAAQTPDRIAAAGLLHGWKAPDPLRASVLEIGCGDGLNLIGIAASAPNSRCAGFDLSAPAIARGVELAAAAGIGNLDLHFGDILSYPRQGERFDYIIAHGVYGWIPAPVRQSLLELIAARLAPGGVAYVSYDCMPAAAAKASINKFLRRRVAHLRGPQAQIAAAMKLINVLAHNQRPDSRLAFDLQQAVARVGDKPGYFFHDWLAEHYAPHFVADVGNAAAQMGLAIAGDVGLSDLYLDAFDGEAMTLLADAAGHAERLALIDMFTGDTIFRRSLLVRADAPPPAETDALGHLRFAFLGEREETDGGDIAFRTGGGRLLARAPAQRQLLDALADEAPGELTADALASRTGLAPETLEGLLRTFAAVGLIECHATPQTFVLDAGERPRTSRLIRTMMARGEAAITLRHARAESAFGSTRLLLTLCDGTRTRAELAQQLGALCNGDVSAEALDMALIELGGMSLLEA